MDPHSFEGRPCEIPSNPTLEWIVQQLPNHTKGEILFLMLPLAVRHEIYDCHILNCKTDTLARNGTGRNREQNCKPKLIIPLTQTCCTFRAEIQGLHASRLAVFRTERYMRAFIGSARKQGLSPYISSIAIDLSMVKVRSMDSLRSIVNAASRDLKFVQWITFYVSMLKQRLSTPIRILTEDGTLQKFAFVEKVTVRDRSIETSFRNFNEQSKDLIKLKVKRWINYGRIDDHTDSEGMNAARAIARLSMLNSAMARNMNRWERELVMDTVRRLLGGEPIASI